LVQPEHMGYTTYRLYGQHFWAEGIFQRFQHASLQIEVSQIKNFVNSTVNLTPTAHTSAPRMALPRFTRPSQ
jgi:hypothetical protein